MWNIRILILALFLSSFARGQFIIDSYRYGFLPHPNADNPNPELFVGDAASFTSEANTITAQHDPLGVAVTSEADTSNGYGQYVARATATSTGSLKRARIDVSGTYTNGEIYEVYILERHNTADDSGRYRIASGSSDGADDTIHDAHTDWVLHTFEFTSDGTVPDIHIYARHTVSATTEYVEFKLSVKLKND